MSANFKINTRKENGDLHLELIGDFDGSSAWELANTIMLRYNREGQVVINAEKVRKVFPFGSAVFENLMKAGFMPVDKLIFKGEKGYEIRRLRQNTLFNDEKSLFPRHGRCVTRCSIM